MYYVAVHSILVPSMGMHDVSVWTVSMRNAGVYYTGVNVKLVPSMGYWACTKPDISSAAKCHI